MRLVSAMRRQHRSAAAIAFALALTFAVTGPVPAAEATGGTQLWAARFGPSNPYGDFAKAVAVSPDGTRVYVTGTSYRAGTHDDYATVAYNANTGAKIWAQRYDGHGTNNNRDQAAGLALSPDGTKLYVTGSSFGPGSDVAGFVTIAYDAATGANLWQRRFSNGGPTAIAVSPDGTAVYVTGTWTPPTGNNYYATVAYDAATGAKVWARHYNGGGSGSTHYDVANALVVSHDGAHVYVTGQSLGPKTGYDFATLAYNAVTGATSWIKRYDGGGTNYDTAYSVQISPDDTRVYVTGDVSSDDAGDYATVAYDAVTGAQVWASRYHGPGNDINFVRALAVGPDGNAVFVTGGSIALDTGAVDYATVAYDAVTGAQVWVSRYRSATYTGSGNLFDFAHALAVSPDSARVYVTGGAEGDYATVAYDAGTGVQAWAGTYDGLGSGDDVAYAVAISPDGSRVFVTGQSFGSETSFGTDFDYATVAYSTG